MSDNTLLNDRELTVNDVGQLENAQQIINFFAELNYNVDDANKLNHAALQLDSDDLRLEIQEIWHIATDPVDEDIKVYLLEVKSVTIKLIQMITRRLREIPGEYLLVLTVDFDELHFVFLDPVLNKSKQIGKSLTRVLRPRIIKVDRQKISRDSVELRVLKRFTFTEEDAVAQRDKLRSAYMLAEWSEQYFNNRALFSDYYLNHRLTDPKTTPEWAEDAAPVLRKVVDLIRDARRRFTGKPEATVRTDLFEPLFDLLGFEYEVAKGGDSSASEPDYRLYESGKRDKPIALALTYTWNRNLDNVEREDRDSETPDEIPGALVVSVLEKDDAPPWVIMTNGKLWRLYSTTASNKATNYYEVDLEEAANATEQIKALKYWWLLFRQQAFTGFLDALLQSSEDYAKGLRERLKDSIFESIFPQFAEGFIANIKAQGVAQADVDAMLPTIFSGTMTFLYRMMFILYAESLELLPIHEDGGYREHSLYTLKNEIARVGGEAESVAQDKLRKKYSPSSLELYERLKGLFHVIDKGSEDLNMPTYNGGLFSTETDSGKFLETYAIPDRYLACGLDRLARDEDDKTKQLVMVDFKSLGVRQLGSIYEGLLEFKLKRAKEDLAVIKDGGKEVYLSAQKAGKKRVLTTVKKGEIYLDNDKSERKATGSYYTPDYIVKYIVEHTVGPVLQRKFDELRPQLNEAQRDYRNYAKLVEARKKAFNPSSQTLLPQGAKGFNADSAPAKQGAKDDPTRLEIPPKLKKRMVELARNFRKAPTPSEDILWQALRGRKLDGRKFRRQQPIGAFVLDFYCAEERLAVEVDGLIHESQQEADRLRQEIIEELGIRFVRVSAKQVETDLPSVLKVIQAAFTPHPPTPSPTRGDGEKANLRYGDGAEKSPSPREERAVADTTTTHSTSPSPREERAVGEGFRVRADSPETFWNSDKIQHLVDDCLNVRVLDPAMGSGHFLVEVVDYVSNRLIDFLNGWSENPVWAMLEQTKQDIVDDLTRQHVSVNFERLNRVALLKRAVLKRVVYGVDLNAMAVELAKVSLWLNAFTLGAPLSFLDHHLKHGNSLIGARVADVQDYLKAKQGEMVDMFSGSKFTQVMLATDMMRKVSYLSDNTIGQAEESKMAYRDAFDLLAPYKRILDVYTSRWFGNGAGKKAKTDNVRLFLQDPQTEAWFKDPTVTLDNSLISADDIATTALEAASDKHFFHWELEFPEVFFAPSTRGGQDVQLRDDGGFDAVVGNPPYLRLQTMQKVDIGYFSDDYKAATKNYDIYTLFIEQGLAQLNSDGRNGFIVPHKFFEAKYGEPLRDLLSSGQHLCHIVHFGDSQIFEGVTTYVCLLLLAKEAQKEFYFVNVDNLSLWETGKGYRAGYISSSNATKDEWNFIVGHQVDIFNKLNRDTQKFGEIFESFVGLQTSADTVYLFTEFQQINQDTYLVRSQIVDTHFELEASMLKPVIRSGNVGRYYGEVTALVLFPYELRNGRAHLIDSQTLERKYPKTWKYLQQNETLLRSRESRKFDNEGWYQLYPKNLALWEQPKIMMPYMINRLSAYPDFENLYFVNVTTGGFGVTVDEKYGKLLYFSTLFNSNLLDFYFKVVSTNFNSGYFAANKQFLVQLPIKIPAFTTPIAEREQRVQQIVKVYQLDNADGDAVLAGVQAALAEGKSDVVHDVLAHLAQVMIDLNQTKQAEVKRFLGWLETVLRPHPPAPSPTARSSRGEGESDLDSSEGQQGIESPASHEMVDAASPSSRAIADNIESPSPLVGEGFRVRGAFDNFTGKTIIQNYLGDYQKGEKELAFEGGKENLVYRLNQNKNKFHAKLAEVKGQIQSEYENSLETLRPIKQQLSRTDALIDRIVYQLYGLTDAEIELIERPQYEQAISEARESVLADKSIEEGSDEALSAIGDKVLPSALRYAEVTDTSVAQASLDNAFPQWRTLPDDLPRLLLSAEKDYLDESRADYSGSVINYAKVVEISLNQKLFLPFRQAGYTANDVVNEQAFKKFMVGRADSIMLGSVDFVLSSREFRFRQFVVHSLYPNAEKTIFAKNGMRRYFEPFELQRRNDAAHNKLMPRAEAQAARAWAFAVLAYL